MKIRRVWAMPNSNTFDIKPIRELIVNTIAKTFNGTNEFWIDPFANKNRLANVTNDIDPEYGAFFCMDALDFLKLFKDNEVEGVLYDPPYSPRQIAECYHGIGTPVTSAMTSAKFWSDQKKEISRIVKKDGRVISFSWKNSGGIGKKYGFEIEEILIVAHGGWHNDTICVVERKIK